MASKKNKKSTEWDYSGPKGKTIFSVLLKEGIVGDFGTSFKIVESGLQKYIGEYSATKDDRAYAIVSAICIENALDLLLQSWMPTFTRLIAKKEMEFTFSFKVEIAISLGLIPEKILTSIEVVRKIRNDFAHNLEITSFEGLVKFDKKRTKPRNYAQSVIGHIRKFDSTYSGRGLRKDFDELVCAIIFGLNLYTTHTQILNKYLLKPKNIKTIFAKLYPDAMKKFRKIASKKENKKEETIGTRPEL